MAKHCHYWSLEKEPENIKDVQLLYDQIRTNTIVSY